MTSRFLTFVIASTFFMAAVLLIDAPGLPMQLMLGAATAVFVWSFARRSPIDGRQVFTAIIVATLGEIVLSLGWGLYSYRNFLIPLYVPPGHGLFYLLAAETSVQTSIRERADAINRVVMTIGTLIAIVSLVAFRDAWGFLWWLGALALMWRSKNRLLLSACFAYTILLEWAGTAIGNWQWFADVPLVRMHSANPPAGVGILYILLDLIVVAITTKLLRAAEAEAEAEPSMSSTLYPSSPASPTFLPEASAHPSAFASEEVPSLSVPAPAVARQWSS